jgi:hypothetical protein
VYRYEGSIVQLERLAGKRDHCGSGGIVHDLRDLISSGRIHEPDAPGRTLTAGRSMGRKNRILIYAVDENFDIHVGFDSERGMPSAVKHETLFRNADVRAAGEIEVSDGIVVEVGDVSGSYGTSGRL